MIYGAILTLILGILSYISFLKSKAGKEQAENAILKSQANQNEYKAEIEQSKLKITETERDYDNAKDDFHSKYGASTGNDESGSNTKP